MQEKLLKELRIANLLKVIEMKGLRNTGIWTPEEYDMRKKLLNYIFDREIEELQYDQAFEELKRKPQSKEYNFHGGDIFDGDC